MIDKVYLVTDLGPGDGGKGGVVHKIANAFHASVILKFGGGQGSHGIMTDSGEKFNFSHWGCGTLEGIPTYITKNFVVIPSAILAEGDALEHRGLADPYAMLTISPSCICVTPYHRYASQLRELARKDNPRGTVGTGAGEAYRMAQIWKSDEDIPPPIKIGHIIYKSQILFLRLRAIANYYRAEFEHYNIEDLLPEDQAKARQLLDAMFDDGLISWTLDEYTKLSQTNLNCQPLRHYLCQLNGNCVAECSHGVLTDSVLGFQPHVSAIRTLPAFTEKVLNEAGFNGKIVRLGVTRAYAVRHGAGPLPTADDTTLGELLPGSHKDENRWQGKVRTGALDFSLLRYAVICCGGAEKFDGICVTWADQIIKTGKWQYCAEYQDFDGQFATESLQKVKPVIQSVDVSTFDRDQLTQLIASEFLNQLNVPVRMISYGPDDQNKILL